MNSLLTYFIEANLYLVSFYLMYHLLLAKNKHFRFNRVFLLMGILFSISLPLLSIHIQPGRSATFEGYIILPAITISNAQTESVGFILKWWHVIGFTYLAGLLFYLVKLIWQLTKILRNLPFLNSTRERKDGYTLVTTNGEIPTCSFFKFLFWDKSVKLSDDEQSQIMEHELVHIRQWHSIDILLTEFLRAIFWFNPVIHFIKSRLTEVHEYLADHYAAKQIDVEKYSQLLTLQIFKSFDFALSNNFHKSQVVKRIRMLKSNRSGSIWINVGLLIPALALLITVLACDVTKLDETKSSPEVTEIVFNETSNELHVQTVPKEIFTIVENQPIPKLGMTGYYEYVQKNLKYPIQARKMGIEGKVFVQFVVDPEGKLTDIKAVKGIGGGCDIEAERVIRESAAWSPGSQRGKKVNVRMILPITFKLG